MFPTLKSEKYILRELEKFGQFLTSKFEKRISKTLKMCAIVDNTYIGFLIQNYYFVVCSCKKENSLGNSYCNNVQCFQLVDLIIKKIVNPGIKNWYILSISAKLKFQA